MNASPTEPIAPTTTRASNPEAQAVANAIDTALPASIKGRLATYTASGIGAVILVAVQYFQPRYYSWLTPGMAETVAGLLGLGVMVIIHDITRSAVFARLRQYLHSLNIL